MKRIITILFLILAIIGASGCINPGDTGETQESMNVVVSSSMEPALYRGDIAIVDKNPDSIQVGDIVIYNATWYPHPIISRVVSIKNDSSGNTLYEMKGDNNPEPDPELVSRSQIISKVTGSIPKIGYITIWINGY